MQFKIERDRGGNKGLAFPNRDFLNTDVPMLPPRPGSSLSSGFSPGAVALGVGAAAALTTPHLKGLEYLDGQNPQVLFDYAQPFLAKNGGPAITMQIFSPDYAQYPNGGNIWDAGLIVSGTIGGRDTAGNIIVYGAAHTLNYYTTSNNITGIRVYTGSDFRTDPGQVLDVNMSTLRIGLGYDGTIGTLDAFGAKLIGDIPGLGNITLGNSPAGSTVIHLGNGYAFSPSQYAAGTVPPRDYRYLAGNAVVYNLPTGGGANEALFNSSTFGFHMPSQGENVITSEGDSSGTVVDYASAIIDQGRLSACTVSGINVGHTGNFGPDGTSIYVDPTSLQFQLLDQGLRETPEPVGTILIALGSLAALSRRRRNRRDRKAECSARSPGKSATGFSLLAN